LSDRGKRFALKMTEGDGWVKAKVCGTWQALPRQRASRWVVLYMARMLGVLNVTRQVLGRCWGWGRPV